MSEGRVFRAPEGGDRTGAGGPPSFREFGCTATRDADRWPPGRGRGPLEPKIEGLRRRDRRGGRFRAERYRCGGISSPGVGRMSVIVRLEAQALQPEQELTAV